MSVYDRRTNTAGCKAAYTQEFLPDRRNRRCRKLQWSIGLNVTFQTNRSNPATMTSPVRLSSHPLDPTNQSGVRTDKFAGSLAEKHSVKLVFADATDGSPDGLAFWLSNNMAIEIASELLISLVEELPVLWDKTIDDYKDKIKTQNAWKEICSILKDGFDLLSDKEKTN